MSRLIRPGDRGDRVRDVQRRLAAALDADLPVDGQFGERTERAVRRFQQQRGLAADGLVGPDTWQALVEANWHPGDRLLWRSRRMMRGDDVRRLQQRLNSLGFHAGPEDGIFGPLTDRALTEFQRNAGLPVDGVAGPGTWEALRRLRRDHQRTGAAVRAREREWLRQAARRGLPGARVMLDPAGGPDDELADAEVAPGLTADDACWEVASAAGGRLAALGAEVVLSRGPRTSPTARERARLANDQAVEAVLVVGLGRPGLRAQGATAYYFGAGESRSEAGRRLAGHALAGVLAVGFGPDCRTHPMTWTILRETRMAAAVVEPAVVGSPDAGALADPAVRDRLAGALAEAVRAFFSAGPDDDGD